MPCLDCGQPGTSMCTPCSRRRARARGTTTQRGYGHAYQKAAEVAKKNATHCPECGAAFTPNNPATGGHVTALREGGSLSDGIVAQCRSCNYGWRRTGL